MAKRLVVLILSFSTIIAYGYALGGLGSYAVGRPAPLPVATGLVCGSVCAAAAIKIWRAYLADIEKEDKLLKEREEKENTRKSADDVR